MASLSLFDEYPIHQTSEPVYFPATSDRNFYDRNWFCGFVPDQSYYFGFTIGVYPNRGVVDAGFSVLADGVQHSLCASGAAPLDRVPTRVGPVQLDVEKPMRRIRVTIAENDTGIHGELVFSARTAAVKEPRQVMWSGSRRTTDATRFNQYGRWSGQITVDGRTIEVDDQHCMGVKDRSWGVRILGAPEPRGPIPPTRPLFVWSQIFWPDHVSHALGFDDSEGRPLVRDAAEVPLYAREADVPGVEDAHERRPAFLQHRITYRPGTRWAESARIETSDAEGHIRSIQLEPLLRFQQRGLGYGHKDWPHGEWRGEDVLDYERFRPADLDPDERHNVHVQHLVRATDGTQEGIGLLEQFILGPYKPAGFADL
ncbi:hypothetical protein [Streptomyces malaysiensis]|uniref:hypothetical protein n=1 Tax=Streptomyces malaysiensis TaxID=92644 RepID=UPI002B2EFFE5|nr:hypothetical protein R8789_08555 [Streptomyces malaysiensis]